MRENIFVLKFYEMYIFGIYLVIAQNEHNTYYKISEYSRIDDTEFLEEILRTGYKFEYVINEFEKAKNFFYGASDE